MALETREVKIWSKVKKFYVLWLMPSMLVKELFQAFDRFSIQNLTDLHKLFKPLEKDPYHHQIL